METNNEIKAEVKAEEKKESGCKCGIFKCACSCSPEKKKKIIIGICIVLIVILGGFAYFKKTKPDFFKLPIGTKAAQDKVLKFANIVQPGTTFEVTGATEESGLYKITIKTGGQEIPTYITKDGKLFFPQAAINIDDAIAQAGDQAAQSADNSGATQKDVPKNAKPTVDLYVMGFCPFGNKAEDTLKPVYNLLKNKVNFNFHYIVTTSGSTVTSLHGPAEVTEDEREACVLRDFGKDKWMNFVTYVNDNCGSDGSCWEAGAKSLGINTASVNACVTTSGLSLMQQNEKASKTANANGSPTLIINGVSTQAAYQYGNSEAYKQAICGAFTTAPAECSQVLSSASTSAAQGGSCNPTAPAPAQ